MGETIINKTGPKTYRATEGTLEYITDTLESVISGNSIRVTGGSSTTFNTASNSKASVSNTSSVIISANSQRKYAAIVNDSDTVIYISFGSTAVINQGIRLNASGGAYEITSNNLYTGDISAICSGSNKNITIIEA